MLTQTQSSVALHHIALHPVALHLYRRRHKCWVALSSLGNCVDTDAIVEWPFCRFASVSASMQLLSNERAADTDAEWRFHCSTTALTSMQMQSSKRAAWQMRWRRRRCRVAQYRVVPLGNCIGVDADAERPVRHSASMSLSTQLSSGERVGDVERPSCLVATLLIYSSHHHQLEHWNYFFAYYFRISVGKTDDVKVNKRRCFTFITMRIQI